MANQVEDPDSLHLWRVSTTVTIPSFSCITCDLGEPQCPYNKVHINSDKDMFIQECLGPGVPFARVVNLQTHGEVFRLDVNDELSDTMLKFAMPKLKTLKIPLPHSAIPARVKLFLPAGFRENEDFRFPLVVEL